MAIRPITRPIGPAKKTHPQTTASPEMVIGIRLTETQVEIVLMALLGYEAENVNDATSAESIAGYMRETREVQRIFGGQRAPRDRHDD